MTKRSEQTKAKLQQAMLDLLAKKPYEAISMEDLARQAGRTRVTVYRHYGDKQGLLLACFESIVETIKEDVIYPQEVSGKSASQIAYTNILVFYTHVANNQALYRALFATSAGNNIRTRFRRFVAGVALGVIEQEGSLDKLPPPANVVGNLVADMIVGAIIWWLESDSTFEPALLAEIALRLAETGFFGLTGHVVTEEDISFRPFPSNG